MFNSLEHCQSPLLQEETGLLHGFFGMSDGKIADDDPDLFAAQSEYVAKQMHIPTERLIFLHQVHSAKVRPVGAKWAKQPAKADGMVTDRPGLALAIKTADCAPVLLADVQAGVIGAAHAGWRGALAGVLQQTVLHMTLLGAQRSRITAAIGPCIAQESYEVGEDFAEKFLQQSVFNAQFFLQASPPKLQFDLAGFCEHQLRESRIKECHVIPVDTFAEKNRYFSYRRALQGGESGYGRNISVLCLP